MQGKIVTGVEADRIFLRAAALRIIKTVLDQPPPKSMRNVRRDLLKPPPISTFRHLEPLGFGVPKGEDWFLFPLKECTPDVVWPLDVGVIVENAGDNEGLFLERFRTVSPKEVRGVVTRFSPFMVRTDAAKLCTDEFLIGSSIMSYVGGEWRDADGHRTWDESGSFVVTDFRTKDDDEYDRSQPRIATALALRQRYEWAVALGLEHSPSIRFATDPTGIKELFRIRDLPEGRDRREALMVWVSDHWRQARHDPEMEIYVRKHLRGALTFNWRGMGGEILPSRFDLEQRDRLIAERADMHAKGTDQRRKQ